MMGFNLSIQKNGRYYRNIIIITFLIYNTFATIAMPRNIS